MFIKKRNLCRFLLVRMKGLEPPRLSAPDPKSGAAANYATSALFILGMQRYTFIKINNKKTLKFAL
jgi:hypothetical protein